MSLAILYSRALDGMSSPQVQVETHLSNGLPSFTLVGLPDTEVKEARDRVRAAVINSGFEFPQKRITVNLAPADLPKESGRFDLPIALGLLAASGQISQQLLNRYEFAGELSLSGALCPIRGALAMALACSKEQRQFILPSKSASEAALAGGIQILAANSLQEVCKHLNAEQSLKLCTEFSSSESVSYPDISEVRGQAQAKRVLEIAAAGTHSLLMCGPPGSGKSMLANRLGGLLPDLDVDSARASAAVLSLTGHFKPEHFRRRSFRSPHHTASAVALVGGGNPPRPGEISLAHKGILFLDEIVEFDKRVLETLREPLESGKIHISRAARYAEFPAEFQLIAALNPCPCGWHGHINGKCRCSPGEIQRYRGKLSGPLLDRIDLQIEVPALPAETLQTHAISESSQTIKNRVSAVINHQLTRQGKANSRLDSGEIEKFCQVDSSGTQLLKQAISRLDLSARAYHRILRVARTIADLAQSANILPTHIAEAVQYRRFSQTVNR